MEYYNKINDNYLALVKSKQYKRIVRVDLLDDLEIPYRSIVEVLSDSGSTLSENYQQGVRKTLSLSIVDPDGSFMPNPNNNIFWIGKKIKVSIGLLDITLQKSEEITGDYFLEFNNNHDLLLYSDEKTFSYASTVYRSSDSYWFTKGIFILKSVSGSLQSGSYSIQIDAVDKFGMLTQDTGYSRMVGSMVIPVGTSILSMLTTILATDIGNGVQLDPKPPIVDLYYKDTVTPMEFTQSAGAYVGDLLCEIATQYRADIYYDNEGYLHFERTMIGTQNVEIPITFDYNIEDGLFYDPSVSYDYATVINSIYVIGTNSNSSEIPMAYIKNTNPVSPIAVPRIGEKCEYVEVSTVCTQQEAQEYAEYLLKYYNNISSALNFNSAYIPHLNVNTKVAINTLAQKQQKAISGQYDSSSNLVKIVPKNKRFATISSIKTKASKLTSIIKGSLNSCTYKGITCTKNMDGSYSFTGALESGYQNFCLDPSAQDEVGNAYPIKIKPNDKIFLTGFGNSVGSIASWFYRYDEKTESWSIVRQVQRDVIDIAPVDATDMVPAFVGFSRNKIGKPVNETVKVYLLNLTEIFGAGNEPTDPKEIRSFLEQNSWAYNIITPNNISKIESRKQSEDLLTTYTISNTLKQYPYYGIGLNTYQNEIDFSNKNYVQRVDKVNLGSLSWSYDTTNLYFYATLAGAILPTLEYVEADLACPRYETKSVKAIKDSRLLTGAKEQNNFIGGAGTTIIIKDTEYSDAAAFKIAINGLECYYAKTSPNTYDISSLLVKEPIISVDPQGFIEIVEDNFIKVNTESSILYTNSYPIQDIQQDKSFTINSDYIVKSISYPLGLGDLSISTVNINEMPTY